MTPDKFRSQALTAATQQVAAIANSCLVPIIDYSDAPTGEVAGSGLHIAYDGAEYLVTASHVVPDGDSRTYYVLGKGGTKALGGYTMRMASKSSPTDLHDIVVFALPENLLDPASFKPLQLRDTDLQRVLDYGDTVAAFGYPRSKNKKFRGDTMKFNIRGFSETTAKREIYAREGFSFDTNLLVNFSKKDFYTPDGERQLHPDPYGMSGGGIWRLAQSIKGLSTKVPYLVGMVIRKIDNGKFVIGVKIGFIVIAVKGLRDDMRRRGKTPNSKPDSHE